MKIKSFVSNRLIILLNASILFFFSYIFIHKLENMFVNKYTFVKVRLPVVLTAAAGEIDNTK